MKSNKLLIIILFFITINVAQAHTCQELKMLTESSNPNPVNHGIEMTRHEILVHTLEYLKKIIDLKYKMVDTLQKNKKVYGKYVALKEEKEEIDRAITSVEEKIAVLETNFRESLIRLDPKLPEEFLEKVKKTLVKEYKKERNKLEDQREDYFDQKKCVDYDYFEITKKWAPFQNYLQQLEALERSMLLSLETVTKVADLREIPVRDLVDQVMELKSTLWLDSYACDAVFQHLIQLKSMENDL